ncbi:MAG: suppressor of fused domain protein [Planctomycetota bacterium]
MSGSVRESGPPVLVGIEAPLHVDVLRVPPDAGRPHWTLVTSGMSDLPLPAGRRGAEPGEEHRCELVLCLPPSWRVRARESRWAWPYELLRGLARLPHLARTPLDYGDTWEPRRGRLVARVVGDGAPFAGVLFRASKLLPLELSTGLRVSGRQIDLLAVVLLEREELELKLTRGIAALLDRLDAEGVSELVDLGRQERRRRSA